MDPFKLVVAGNRAPAHSNGINHDVVAEKDFEHVAIAGRAAVLAAIADDENYLAALSRSF